jgi:hypothetical protein
MLCATSFAVLFLSLQFGSYLVKLRRWPNLFPQQKENCRRGRNKVQRAKCGPVGVSSAYMTL